MELDDKWVYWAPEFRYSGQKVLNWTYDINASQIWKFAFLFISEYKWIKSLYRPQKQDTLCTVLVPKIKTKRFFLCFCVKSLKIY